MLAVTVHREHNVTGSRVQSCAQRRLMSEVPAQLNYRHTRIAGRETLKQFLRAVARAIVHINVVAAEAFRHRDLAQQFVKGANTFLLVKKWNDKVDNRHGMRRLL